MREEVLASFFKGDATPAEPSDDLKGSERRVSEIESVVKIEDMREEIVVTRRMAVSLCDAVLSRELEPGALATIGFALMASDKFSWDGEDVLGEIIANWSCPEVNYPLNLESVGKFRSWLTGEIPYPDRRGLPTGTSRLTSRLISVRRKEKV